MRRKKKNSSSEKALCVESLPQCRSTGQRQPREGKKSRRRTKTKGKNLSLFGKFEIPDRGRNYGGKGEEYEAALSNTVPTSSTRFSCARFNSLEATGNDIFKACRSRVRSTQTAYHQLDFMGHLRYDTIQPL